MATLVVLVVLEEHEIDQESGGQQTSLGCHCQVPGEGDTEVVGVGKHLLDNASPLFSDLANLVAGRCQHVKDNVSARCTLAHWADNLNLRLSVWTADVELWLERAASLTNETDHCPTG